MENFRNGDNPNDSWAVTMAENFLHEEWLRKKLHMPQPDAQSTLVSTENALHLQEKISSFRRGRRQSLLWLAGTSAGVALTKAAEVIFHPSNPGGYTAVEAFGVSIAISSAIIFVTRAVQVCRLTQKQRRLH